MLHILLIELLHAVIEQNRVGKWHLERPRMRWEDVIKYWIDMIYDNEFKIKINNKIRKW